jgi:hypothetical protein
LLSDAADGLDEDECDCIEWFIMPVLVVPDGVMWTVDYDATGTKIQGPQQIEMTTFYLDHAPWTRGQRFSYTISHLHFVTITGMAKFVDDLVNETGFGDRIFPEAP